ncbi:hypothetical protein MAR_003843 [Mya arenaria]|uniref:Uncharacterized protein n=1 Tax=Mya arenaria TaxID=6604 RepID=A0ABY7EUX2_MYAAR|nr:hypothetical protein MAR_003843 [Mya arenaria]
MVPMQTELIEEVQKCNGQQLLEGLGPDVEPLQNCFHSSSSYLPAFTYGGLDLTFSKEWGHIPFGFYMCMPAEQDQVSEIFGSLTTASDCEHGSLCPRSTARYPRNRHFVYMAQKSSGLYPGSIVIVPAFPIIGPGSRQIYSVLTFGGDVLTVGRINLGTF